MKREGNSFVNINKLIKSLKDFRDDSLNELDYTINFHIKIQKHTMIGPKNKSWYFQIEGEILGVLISLLHFIGENNDFTED